MRFFSSIKQRLILSSLLPGILAAVLMIAATSWLFYHQLREQCHERWLAEVQSLAELSLPLFTTGNNPGLQQLATAGLNLPTVRTITILDATGKELAHAGPQHTHIDPVSWPSTSLANGYPGEKKYHSQTEGSTIRFLWPLRSTQHSSTPIGWLDVEFSSTTLDLLLYQIMAISALVLLIIICFSVVTVAFMFRHSTRGLSEIVGQLRDVADGKQTGPLPRGDNDEINLLITALNDALGSLRNQIEDMQENIKHSTQDLRETLETIEVQNIELDLARKEALQASKMKSEFLANTSHEIRTPLNGIIGFTRILLKNCKDPQQYEYLLTIERSSESLLAIINDILDLSKMEAGKLVLDYSPFSLNTITEETLQILAPAAHEKTLELTSIMDDGMPEHFYGDPLRIRQILTNLVGNAIKFSSRGGITVRFSLENIHDNTSVIKCSVTDSGVGISQHKINQNLFDAFTQGANNQHKQQDGTGLGLAISKKLVTRMGGDIGIASEENIGSTFWFTLKLDINRDAESKVYHPRLNGMSILLYDASPISSHSFMHLLTQWGARVTLTQRYNDILPEIADAASAPGKQAFGVVIISIPTDHHDFPAERLGDLARHICQQSPLIICSPTTLKHYLSRQLPAEVSFISKPVLRDKLLQALGATNSTHILDKTASQQNTISPHSGCSILVVDDHPTNLKLMSHLLAELGHHVTEAASGREALHACQQEIFQLVLMDIRMPGMDGVETTQRIRSLSNENHLVPVIAVTAHALTEQKQQLLLSGLDDYLSKPVDSAQLEHMIARWTRHRGTQSKQQAAEDHSEAIEHCVDKALGLKLSNGRPELAAELLEMLLQDLQQQHADIHRALDEAMLGDALELIHRLHGACCYCGVPQLKDACHRLELHIKTMATRPAAVDIIAFDLAVAALLDWYEHHDVRTLFETDI